MSHFVVGVVTPPTFEPPTESDLNPILMPWHEYECTGYDNEYVKFVDDHDALLEDAQRVEDSYFRDPVDGKIKSAHEDARFIRKPTPEEHEEHYRDGGPIGYRYDGSGLVFMREGVRDYSLNPEFERGFSALDFHDGDLAAWAERKGYVIQDGRLGRRTNPNAKWDYWCIGGRYGNRLPSNQFQVPDDPDWLIKMKTEMVNSWVAENTAEIVKQLANDGGIDTFREFWDDPEFVACGRKINDFQNTDGRYSESFLKCVDRSLIFCWGADLAKTFDEAVLGRIDPADANLFYAIVADGEWHGKGDMGWFGCDSNVKDNWSAIENEILGKVEPGSWITVVDCHI